MIKLSDFRGRLYDFTKAELDAMTTEQRSRYSVKPYKIMMLGKVKK
jgi:hypothetical protein